MVPKTNAGTPCHIGVPTAILEVLGWVNAMPSWPTANFWSVVEVSSGLENAAYTYSDSKKRYNN